MQSNVYQYKTLLLACATGFEVTSKPANNNDHEWNDYMTSHVRRGTS